MQSRSESENPVVGISGMAVYLPPWRVDLAQWCGWTGADPAKTRAVVGHAFRMPGPDENVYTLAANAVLRLIGRCGIDPARVGYLALGTESSIDNAAGAVIVRGLVDMALVAEGKPPLARDCEVPEFKHACLGGVYALKGALRYLATDGRDRQAIVVAADMAEYARGSSGEPTQGAGAVAMLLEAAPRLLAFDLARSGSASAYRGLDFRKPFLRFAGQAPGPHGRLTDLPVFNGKYSTDCYTDATLRALAAMAARGSSGSRRRALRDAKAVFMHRPYHHMPRSAWAMAQLAALAHDAEAGDADARHELAGYCESAAVSIEDALREWRDGPAPCPHDALPDDAYPVASALLRVFRKSESARLAEQQLQLGSAAMLELGNLYTAALQAWIAAGFDEACAGEVDRAGQDWLVLGYGSGDAAEALPARVAEGWREAAAAIDFAGALNGAIDLDADAYAALHDHGTLAATLAAPARGVLIDHIGTRDSGAFQDYGIAYYRYAGKP